MSCATSLSDFFCVLQAGTHRRTPDHLERLTEIRLLPEPREGARRPPRSVLLEHPALADEQINSQTVQTWQAEGYGVFYGVLPRHRRPASSSTDADVAFGEALWADLDAKGYPGGKGDAVRKLKACPVAPSILVDSGNGYHAIWLLEEPASCADVSATNRQLALHLGADVKVCNPSRILRLPGSFNLKDPRDRRPVVLLSFAWRRRYHLVDFAFCRPAAPAVTAPCTAAPSAGPAPGRELAYALGALKGTVTRVSQLGNGGRATGLFAEAAGLGRFVRAGLLLADQVEAQLFDAARHTGLPDHEIRRNLRNGIALGAATP